MANPHRPRRVLLSGYYGFANAGDEAVLAGLVQSLRAEEASLEITVLSRDPDETQKTHGVHAVHRYRLQDLLPALARTDLLLSGGGSLLQDVTSAHGILYYLGVVRLAQFMGKKTMFIAQGIGPLERPRTRRLVAQVAQRLDAITVRDPGSADLLRVLGVTRPSIEVTADPALLIPTSDTNFRSATENTFAVSLRHWQSRDIATLAAEACRLAFPTAQALPIVMQPALDGVVMEQFSQSWRPTMEAPSFSHTRDLPSLMHNFASSQLTLGMRLHALILAAASGVPAVALSYDPKVAAFMAQSGQADAVFDLRQDDPTLLAPLLARCWSERAERATALRARLPDLRAAAQRNAQIAVSLLP